MKAIIGIGMVAFVVVAAGCPREETAKGERQLWVGLSSDGAKAAGSTVQYDVRTSSGPSVIDAFGLDIRYDTEALRYTGAWSRGALTEGFTQVGVNEIQPGTLRLGGFTVAEPIPLGSTGALASLEFEVLSKAPEELGIASQVDDIVNYTSSAN